MENENTNLQEALNLLDELLEDSFDMPLTKGKSLIDYNKFRELLDTVKVCLPHEIEESKEIVAQKDEILASATREAEELLRAAKNKAQELVSKEAVVRSANDRAYAILEEAKQKQNDLMQQVQSFFEEVLGASETTLKKSLIEIEGIKDSMRK